MKNKKIIYPQEILIVSSLILGFMLGCLILQIISVHEIFNGGEVRYYSLDLYLYFGLIGAFALLTNNLIIYFMIKKR